MPYVPAFHSKTVKLDDIQCLRKERIPSDKDLYWLWLCNIENVWNASIRKILQIFGTPEEAFKADGQVVERELAKAGLNGKMIGAVLLSREQEKVKTSAEMLQKLDIAFIHCEDSRYPAKLKNIHAYPYGFYVKGRNKDIAACVEGEGKRTVAIVGARNCSEYGRKIAGELGYALATQGVGVISGMAVGIDGAAHGGALRAESLGDLWAGNPDGQQSDNPDISHTENYLAGVSIAVLGSGVDYCYPIQNYELYEEILAKGAILSEYPPKTKPLAWQFPQRNRIISGLVDKIIVVEARKKSGSLITVEYGLEQGKDIYAVPGRLGDVLSEGCNHLIREGAGILTSCEQILEELEWSKRFQVLPEHNEYGKKGKIGEFDKDLEEIYRHVEYYPKSVEHIMEETGMEMTLVFKNLIELQLKGLIREQAKNCYVRT